MAVRSCDGLVMRGLVERVVRVCGGEGVARDGEGVATVKKGGRGC